jgi:tRNA 2-thiouridine synthesizing protein A
MPVIRTQNLVATLAPGDTVDVFCTDHGALNDIPAWCRINGHQVISTRATGDEVVVRLQVGAAG